MKRLLVSFSFFFLAAGFLPAPASNLVAPGVSPGRQGVLELFVHRILMPVPPGPCIACGHAKSRRGRPQANEYVFIP